MNPYPLALLNHLTLPVIRIVLFLACWWHCHQTLLSRPTTTDGPDSQTKKKTARAAFPGSRNAVPHGYNTGVQIRLSITDHKMKPDVCSILFTFFVLHVGTCNQQQALARNLSFPADLSGRRTRPSPRFC